MDRSPNVKLAVPLFAVTNMENSLRLYIDGLGFTMHEKWIDDGKLRWCWLYRKGRSIASASNGPLGPPEADTRRTTMGL